jgi:thiol:disulfide interchange protein DsbG
MQAISPNNQVISNIIVRKDHFWMGVAILSMALSIVIMIILFLAPSIGYKRSDFHSIQSDRESNAPAITQVSIGGARALIGKASHNRIAVKSTFLGPDGLTGIVMSSKSGDGIGWITPGGKNIIVGTVMDSNGTNLSKQAHQTFIKSAEIGGSQLTDLLQSLPSIELTGGKSSKTLYVFGDTNCRYCEELFRMITETQNLGAHVRWIPVAILGDKSLGQAATLLDQENDSMRLALLKRHHGALHDPIQSMAHDNPVFGELKAQIEKSTNVLARLGQGTPLLAYENAEGKVDIFPKMPSREELNQIVAKIKE